ncbi:hypothetical protein [Nostoc sp.]|uniref:hypothetical protein n=1 Tax=Nostoc sp. TaxID=1180 RepID=UPI002FFA0E65
MILTEGGIPYKICPQEELAWFINDFVDLVVNLKMGISIAHKCCSAVIILVVTLYNQVYKVEFILAANSLTLLNCNSGSTMFKIFKAKIYLTNEPTTCISQIIGCELLTLGACSEYEIAN